MSHLWGNILGLDTASPEQSCPIDASLSLGLLYDDLQVTRPCSQRVGLGADQVAGSINWPAIGSLLDYADSGCRSLLSAPDVVLEQEQLDDFSQDAELACDGLRTPLQSGACLDLLCDAKAPQHDRDELLEQRVNPIGHLPESLLQTDQVAPFTFLQPLPLNPEALSCTPDHSFSLELGSEVDISEGDRKSDSTTYITIIPQCIKEEDVTSDNDSGICMSPESYLGSPQHSPSTSRASPNRNLLSPATPCGSAGPKPYDPPVEKVVAAKVKGEKLDKRLKKMEQNKTAATRYRQKKRAEQEALTGECQELEKRNEALKEKADSLAKEIQYLKDLMEEVRKARGKKQAPS
ncbi:hypothetical protein QTO34_018050 [Cnephaeus nilssonii]|uniref:Cyclic AMP-dependent transcription factor ATF-4 n=1 Tax=Cnephaeus nilssonii TaxID=3371016 RepID=A0AA40I249_CNENI|nr:hypothetical protein QTO34_018050 [Eptesicus nilssonii]